MKMLLAPVPQRPRASLLLTAVGIALASSMAFAQNNPGSGATSSPPANASPSTGATFDVATIKLHAGVMRMMGLMKQPDGYEGTVRLSMLVQYAYGLRTEDQVSGAPDWAKTEWFDIQAKMSPEDIAEMQKLSPAESSARRQLMFQALLAERFKLKAHSATKQVPVFELVVAKGGSKLKDAATDSSESLEKGKDGKPLTGMLRFLKDTSVAQGESIQDLANFLSQPVAGVGRPVLDKTGLTGTYDFKLNWSVYSAHIAVANGVAVSDAPDDAPSIFTALQEVGLKLQPANGAIETIVIDNVERPSEN